MNMRFGFVMLALLSTPLLAQASCDTVKAGIDAKIKANGVSNYTLDVVPANQAVSAGKAVGYCEGDQRIVYTRGAEAAHAAGADSAAPAASSSSGG